MPPPIRPLMARRRPPLEDAPAQGEARRRLRRYAWFLDDSIAIPGTSYRIGADAVVGLVPGIGDVLGAFLSSYVLVEAVRIGVSKAVFFRMVLNVLVETAVGTVPFVGDLFDMAFKANERNVSLLEQYLDAPQETARTSRTIAASVAVAFLIVLVVLFALAVWLVRWLWLAWAG